MTKEKRIEIKENRKNGLILRSKTLMKLEIILRRRVIPRMPPEL